MINEARDVMQKEVGEEEVEDSEGFSGVSQPALFFSRKRKTPATEVYVYPSFFIGQPKTPKSPSHVPKKSIPSGLRPGWTALKSKSRVNASTTMAEKSRDVVDDSEPPEDSEDDKEEHAALQA